MISINLFTKKKESIYFSISFVFNFQKKKVIHTCIKWIYYKISISVKKITFTCFYYKIMNFYNFFTTVFQFFFI